MNTLFILLLILSAVGIWYFIKKKPNKKYRNYSAIVMVVCFILVGITSPSSNKEEVENKPAVSSKNDITLKLNDKTAEVDKDGKAIIEGKTNPGAKIQIGFGIKNDSVLADDKGKFVISYKLSEKNDKIIEITSSLDGNSSSKKITIKPSSEYLAALEKKEKEDEEKALASSIEKDNKKKQENEEKELKESADKDITILSDEPTAGQSIILYSIATQKFEQLYPYKGSKINATRVTQDWKLNDGKWFYKGEATISNAYGSERTATIEINVTPTAPDTGIVEITDY